MNSRNRSWTPWDSPVAIIVDYHKTRYACRRCIDAQEIKEPGDFDRLLMLSEQEVYEHISNEHMPSGLERAQNAYKTMMEESRARGVRSLSEDKIDACIEQAREDE